jgi:hypothetical protein
MNELGPELLFEPRESAAHRGLRHVEVPGSTGEALMTNHLDERCYIVPIGSHIPLSLR